MLSRPVKGETKASLDTNFETKLSKLCFNSVLMED